MKRVILLAVIQAVVLFFIIGGVAMPLKATFLQLSGSGFTHCRNHALCFAYATEIVLPKKAAEIAEKA